MDKYQAFNERNFRNHPEIHWEGRTGILPLAGRMMAEITLSTRAKSGMPTHGDYTGYVVRILSVDGALTSKQFAFDSYLGRDDRIDDRVPGTGAKYPFRTTFKIVSHVAIDWYICVPNADAVEAMADAVVGWCKRWEHLA